MLNWHAIQFSHRQHDTSRDSILSLKLRVLIPVIEVKKDYCKATRTYIEPVFRCSSGGGYGFVEFDFAEHGHKVRWARGVRGLPQFGIGTVPPIVPEWFIDEINSRLDPRGYVVLDPPTGSPSGHRRGDWLTITEGPLASVPGIFQRDTDDNLRVVLLYSLMGRQFEQEFPQAHVRVSERFEIPLVN